MTSMDSGVDMGTDSNDSFITQQEFTTAGPVTTITTTTTTTTTTPMSTLNFHTRRSTFPVLHSDMNTDNNDTFMPINNMSPIIFKPSGLEELRHPVDRLRCKMADMVKYKPICHGKIKSMHSSRNRVRAWSYIFNRDPPTTNNLLLTKMRLAAVSHNTMLTKRFLMRMQTALHIASSIGDTGMVQMLLLNGANPNERDSVDNTPLHLASLNCHVSIITLLLRAGADIMSRNKDGFNPLELAQEHLRDDMVKVKKEVHEVVNLLLTHLQKQKNSQETVEALSSLSLSNRDDQV